MLFSPLKAWLMTDVLYYHNHYHILANNFTDFNALFPQYANKTAFKFKNSYMNLYEVHFANMIALIWYDTLK